MCETLKKCTKCGVEKDLAEYPKYKRPSGKIVSASICRECKRLSDRVYSKTESGKSIRLSNTRKYANSDKRKQQRVDKWFAENVGAVCEFQVFHCAGCNKVKRYRHTQQPPTSGYLKCCQHLHRWECQDKEVECVKCGILFIGKFANTNCPQCVRKSVRISKNKARREYVNHMNRAKKYGVVWEKVRRSVVYKRDNYTCYACECKVIECREYRPNQATLDHVIPMAKGGPHTYANVKTMCMECNTKKCNFDAEYIIPMLKNGTWLPTAQRNKAGSRGMPTI